MSDITEFKNAIFEAAKEYAQRGWQIFPVHTVIDGKCTCGDPNCANQGKHPACKNGFKDATNQPAQIMDWFGMDKPPRNIGVATGAKSGVTVIDVDMGLDKDGKQKKGGETWAQISNNVKPWNTLTVETQSGGRHFYFAYNDGDGEGNNALGEHVDQKGDGGYVVAPPSRCAKGVYRWLNQGAPTNPTPAWLFFRLKNKYRQDVEKGSRRQKNDAKQATNQAGKQAKEKVVEKTFNILNWADFKPLYLAGIEKRRALPLYATDFTLLNEALNGGWQSGELYILGGLSGIGKTAFALQAGEAVAKQGHTVLYVSLEMPAHALIARLVSKWAFEKGYSFWPRTVLVGGRGWYAQAEYELFDKKHAAILCENQATLDRFQILEGNVAGVSVENVHAVVEAIVEKTQTPPFVVIDYFQLLQSELMAGGTDKQNADGVVFGLKQIANQFNTPILAISALNRENYNQPITMAALKESGALEYTADVVIGLQYAITDEVEKDFALQVGKKKKLMEVARDHFVESCNKNGGDTAGFVDLKILKNRYGAKTNVRLRFSGERNVFF